MRLSCGAIARAPSASISPYYSSTGRAAPGKGFACDSRLEREQANRRARGAPRGRQRAARCALVQIFGSISLGADLVQEEGHQGFVRIIMIVSISALFIISTIHPSDLSEPAVGWKTPQLPFVSLSSMPGRLALRRRQRQMRREKGTGTVAAKKQTEHRLRHINEKTRTSQQVSRATSDTTEAKLPSRKHFDNQIMLRCNTLTTISCRHDADVAQLRILNG